MLLSESLLDRNQPSAPDQTNTDESKEFSLDSSSELLSEPIKVDSVENSRCSEIITSERCELQLSTPVGEVVGFSPWLVAHSQLR